ncbi:MAG: hypothetical protein JWM88_2668, partial [Verrucomicrobia bacterium]|nr:hypothetical protein [Verrucomicrobiota bacterium]
YLVLDNDSILWITHQVSATSMMQATRRRDAIAFHLRNRTFSAVYVFQRYNINPATGAMTLREGDDPGPDYVLETVREERLQFLALTRISRVVEVRQGKASLTARPAGNGPVVSKDRAEIEKLRKAYLENFIKQLP